MGKNKHLQQRMSANAKQATPLFLSSSRDATNDSDETSFTCRLTPPLRISEKASKVSAYIDSAIILGHLLVREDYIDDVAIMEDYQQ